MRWIKAIGGFAALVLLMAGCLKYEGTIEVDDDGSGTVNLIRAIDPNGMGEEIAAFVPVEELCSEFDPENEDLSTFPADATSTDYSDDGFCGSEISFTLPPGDDHSAIMEGVFEDGGARLFKSGENWIFETNFDTSDLSNDSDGLISDEQFEEMLGDSSVKFTVDLPGRAIDGQTNATTVGSDGRFEWDIDLLNPPTRLFAQTEPGSGGGDGGGGLGLILIIAAVLLLAAAAAWWFLTQRTKSTDDGPSPLGATSTAAAAAAPAAAVPPVAAPPASAQPSTAAPVPASAASAPNPAPEPVRPADPAAQPTVAMSASDAQAAAQQAQSAAPQPEWDAARNAWVIHDPVQGTLVHDAATDSWKPA